jgi:hypothetical protein
MAADDNFTDAVLAELTGLRNLEELQLIDGSITDAGVRQLKELPRLGKLGVWKFMHSLNPRQPLSPAAFKELVGLQELRMAGTGVKEADWAALQQLKELRALTIEPDPQPGNSGVGDVGLQGIAGIKSLRKLNMPLGGQVTKAGWDVIGGLTELQALELVGFADAGFPAVGRLTGLQELRLYGSFKDEGFKSLGRMTNLSSLKIADGFPLGTGQGRLTGVGLQALQGNKGLKELELSGSAIGDPAMKQVKVFSGLRFLNLQSTGVTDVGLRELQDLKGLEKLNLLSNRTTPRGQAELQKALPKLTITTSSFFIP